MKRKRVPKTTRRASTPGRVVTVNLATVPCAFCKGTGRDPYGLSPLSNCVACGGRKTVLVREPYETCGACVGTGLYFRSHMYCWPCRGKGVVPIRAESAKSTGAQPAEVAA